MSTPVAATQGATPAPAAAPTMASPHAPATGGNDPGHAAPTPPGSTPPGSSTPGSTPPVMADAVPPAPARLGTAAAGPAENPTLPSATAPSLAAPPVMASPPAAPASEPRVAATGTMSAHPAAPAGAAPATSVANQILPAVIAMARGGAGNRVSVSITPEDLGQVSISVARAADGTTTIAVAAERLATLDLLRKDQTGLSAALDQAGFRPDSHSLSFSWDGGGGGGMPGWGGGGGQAGQRAPARAVRSYADEAAALPGAALAAAAARGGVDVTA